MLALPRLRWTLTFPEAEAEGLGREEHGCVRVSSTSRAKTRKLCYIHFPARGQKWPAGIYFHCLVFKLKESVKYWS